MTDPRPDPRQAVLAGIDKQSRGLTKYLETADGDDERLIDCCKSRLHDLRLLRKDTERHTPTEFNPCSCGICGGPEPDDPPLWCSWCGSEWPCDPIRERAEVYAPEVLR